MKEFKDNVAVITGTASGIGRALAQKCVSEGIKFVISDIQEKNTNTLLLWYFINI